MSVSQQHYFSQHPDSVLEPREVEVVLAGQSRTLLSAGGTFSAGRLDRGTEVLLNEVPEPPEVGNLLDLGCGWGPIALTMALRSPQAHTWGVDVNERALELSRANAERLQLTQTTFVRPEDLPEDLRFDAIWSNPPIRVGKAVLHDLMRSYLPRLTPDAAAHLVVAKKLGADSLLRWLNEELAAYGSAERISTDAGFRVLRFQRSR